jgi:hypothetical protein
MDGDSLSLMLSRTDINAQKQEDQRIEDRPIVASVKQLLTGAGVPMHYTRITSMLKAQKKINRERSERSMLFFLRRNVDTFKETSGLNFIMNKL